MLHYIINTIVFQLLFLIIYDLFLKKETFFNWNRAYILITSLCSLVIPVIKINHFKSIFSQDFVISLPVVIIGSTSQADANNLQLDSIIMTSKPMWSWELVLYIGMILAASLFLIKIAKLLLMILKNPRNKTSGLFIVTLLNSHAAFSCFHYIFLGEKIQEKDRASILKHEMIHVKEKHTWDLLFFELLRILFWFNPLVYVYQNRIMQLHEFIADNKASKNLSKTDYYENLLSRYFQTENISFINSFFKQSLIKKRIVMLQKSKSKQTNLLKYTLLIPVILGMLIYNSIEAQDAKKSNSNDDHVVDVIPLNEINMEVPYSVIDKVPVYPGCGDKEEEEKRKCMSEGITDFVMKNFNKDLIQQKGLRGRQRVNIIFKIDKKGHVTGIRSRSEHPFLETEASRVISLLPKMTPGKQGGKDVVVLYSLPIIFDVTDNNDTQMLDEIFIDYKINNDPDIPFSVVDRAPIFPDCESFGTSKEQRDCLSKSIARHVNRNFDIKKADSLNLKGRQRINVIFKVNKEGQVVDIRSRAPHPVLEAEAIRVVNTIPRMIAGEHKGKKVNVLYSLPIIFQVKSPKSSDK